MNYIALSTRAFDGRAARQAAAVTLLLALLLAGCARDKFAYGVVPRFSMNVAPPPGWLDQEKAPLAPGEKEVLSRRGRPDFVRYWWNADGRPVTSSDFAGRMDQFPLLIKGVKKSWIYLEEDKGEEVVFLRNGAAYSLRPLTDALKLLCKYGDPSNRVNPVVLNGEKHETWMWIEHGVQAELVDGRIDAIKNFQGTGMGTYILK